MVDNKGFRMERPIINIYCDESCHLRNDHHKSMVIGGVSCPISKVRDITSKIKITKEKFGIPRNQEVKWTKISPAKKDFYSELVDLFIREDCLRFRAVKVQNKDILKHEEYHQTHNEWYYKMYYTMLTHILKSQKDYNIYIDIKDTIGCEKIRKLKGVLERKKQRDDLDILNIQQIRSHESEILQLADILIGAVGYKDRLSEIINPNQVKILLCKKIENELSVDFDRKSRFADEKFNLLIWEGNK